MPPDVRQTSTPPAQAYAINHIGVTVPDIDAAIAFYRDVLGFAVMSGPVELTGDGPAGETMRDVCGASFGAARCAWLAGGDNGVGFELFEFTAPRTEPSPNTWAYWASGVFHLSVTARDVDGLVAAIEAAGGERISRTWEFHPGCFFAYTRDPFGTHIEINNRSFERFNANREG